jgi:chemotaxis protein methyltransferase CheR
MDTTPARQLSAQGSNEREELAGVFELELLLEAVHRCYGYDYRGYQRASLKRRVRSVMEAEGVRTISALQERILRSPECLDRFLRTMAVSVTSMYRDPQFFLTFRKRVVPQLRTYPFIRIWHAGCSTGEEVYSLAILLQEEGIYDRCRIYATDVNESVLKQAKQGIFSLEAMRRYAVNYQEAGGTDRLENYYTAAYGNAMMRSSLRDGVLFSQHNLATDSSFNEFNVVLCRNVMIYFQKELQNRVHELLYDSLALSGYLGLGHKETLQSTPHENNYLQLECGTKLYRRIS